MKMNGQLHTPATLPPEKKASIHRTVGWVGPTDGLDNLEKIMSG